MFVVNCGVLCDRLPGALSFNHLRAGSPVVKFRPFERVAVLGANLEPADFCRYRPCSGVATRSSYRSPNTYGQTGACLGEQNAGFDRNSARHLPADRVGDALRDTQRDAAITIDSRAFGSYIDFLLVGDAVLARTSRVAWKGATAGRRWISRRALTDHALGEVSI